MDELENGEQIQALAYANLEDQAALLGIPQEVARTKGVQNLIKKAGAPKAAIPSGLSATSRDEAMRRLDALPKHILKGLTDKRLQLSDSYYFQSKVVATLSETRMFQNTDTKNPGIGNVAFQKLEKDNFFLPTGIQLVYGTNAVLAATTYGVAPAAIVNGDFEFKANGKYLMPKDSSCRIFDTTSQTNVLIGYSRIHNPKWIEPQVDIIFDLRFAAAAAANANLMVVLHGVSVMPY